MRVCPKEDMRCYLRDIPSGDTFWHHDKLFLKICYSFPSDKGEFNTVTLSNGLVCYIDPNEKVERFDAQVIEVKVPSS